MEITACREPFPHWIVEDAVPDWMITAALAEMPTPEWPLWVKYDNDIEKKRTTRDVMQWPQSLQNLYRYLVTPSAVGQVAEITSIYGLRPDPTLHGGGFHICDKGGFLGPHIDYAVHPKFHNMQRKVNLILYLNQNWNSDWGGETLLYNDDATEVMARVQPKYNRALIWVPGDVTYHSVNPLADVADPRVTLAVYYIAPKEPGVTRKRALFVPSRKVA